MSARSLTVESRLVMSVLTEPKVLAALSEPGARRVRIEVNDSLASAGIGVRLSRSEVHRAIVAIGQAGMLSRTVGGRK